MTLSLSTHNSKGLYEAGGLESEGSTADSTIFEHFLEYLEFPLVRHVPGHSVQQILQCLDAKSCNIRSVNRSRRHFILRHDGLYRLHLTGSATSAWRPYLARGGSSDESAWPDDGVVRVGVVLEQQVLRLGLVDLRGEVRSESWGSARPDQCILEGLVHLVGNGALAVTRPDAGDQYLS